MKRAALGIWIATGVILAAAALLLVFLVVPETARLKVAVINAHEAEESLAHLEATGVDDEFERDLRMFSDVRSGKAADVEVARARLAALLDAPFPDMKVAPGASRPTSDEFQRAYNFNGDQLKSRIRDFVSRSGGPAIPSIPLIAPRFPTGSELDPATMKRWQRYANIEARVLETAAKSGAFPASVVKLEDQQPGPDDADAGYERIRIGLELYCPDGRVGALIHSLLPCFDEMGGITRLTGMIESPVTEERLREKPESPIKRVSVTLALGFPSPIEEAP